MATNRRMSALDRAILTGGSDSVLAGMWRQIAKDLGIDDTKVEDLIDKFASNRPGLTTEQKSQVRGNLRGELNNSTMTWIAFMKGLQVLRVERFSLLITLQHLNVASNHTLTYDFATEQDEETEVEDKKPNTLSLFLSGIFDDLNINLEYFDRLMTSYMARSRIPITISNRTHVRGNLKKELLGFKLTWRSFIKALNFIRVTRFEMRMHVFLKRGGDSIHTRVIVLNDEEDFPDEPELLLPLPLK